MIFLMFDTRHDARHFKLFLLRHDYQEVKLSIDPTTRMYKVSYIDKEEENMRYAQVRQAIRACVRDGMARPNIERMILAYYNVGMIDENDMQEHIAYINELMTDYKGTEDD